MYKLIYLLHNESKQVEYDCTHLIQGRIGRQDKQSTKLTELWDQLSSGDIGAKKLLEHAAQLNGPCPKFTDHRPDDVWLLMWLIDVLMWLIDVLMYVCILCELMYGQGEGLVIKRLKSDKKRFIPYLR